MLTQTGAGTPCGELMRRYWQPAALSEELPLVGAPQPVRLLGEDLVLFRDEAGRPGLLGLHCSHRGADLSYGRLEENGLRCIYHGWLYDIHGRCLEQPGEPAGSAFHDKIRHPAYPCREVGGIIFTYMGPGEPPLIPDYEIFKGDPDCRSVTKIYRECNYLQANEGNLDSVHLSLLHNRVRFEENGRRLQSGDGPFDIIEFDETDYGLRCYWVRKVARESSYLHVTNFVMPNLAYLSGRVNWHVPIDDTHHWEYVLVRSDDPGQIRTGDESLKSQMTADYRLIRTHRNRYLQDRETMKIQSFSGLGPNNYPEDACVTDGAGAIQDRTQEHLGYGDKAIVALRLLMMRSIRDVQMGRDPHHIVRDPGSNHFLHLPGGSEALSSSTDWREYWRETVAGRVLTSLAESGVARGREAP